MHKGQNSLLKTESWVDIEKTSKGNIYVKSVRAFLKKKHAKEWLDEQGLTHLIIKTATIN